MKLNTFLFAEDVNYWQTSRMGSDAWLDKAKKEIQRAGGQVVGSASVTDEVTGRAGFMLAFQIGEDRFKLSWPVLKPRRGSTVAARIQAATALYHEVKSACVKAKFLGTRHAFLAFLVLPDGRVAAEVGGMELVEALPRMLLSGSEL
jgi:hypothetical protein